MGPNGYPVKTSGTVVGFDPNTYSLVVKPPLLKRGISGRRDWVDLLGRDGKSLVDLEFHNEEDGEK